jgi:hypothetical protein
MLEKARREHGRLTATFNIDNVFNFFVTAYHIQDYIRESNAAPPATIDAFVTSQDIQDARDLCDKGKHLHLTRRKYPDPSTSHRVIGPLNTVPLNTMVLNGYEETWVLQSGARTVDVAALADRVIRQWEAFFDTNGL